MSDDFRSKTLRLKQGNVKVRRSGDVTALVWNDTRDVHVLTNIHNPPTEANFCQETGNAWKPAVVEDYSHYIGGGGYFYKSDGMHKCYFINRRMSKCTEKLFLLLLDFRLKTAAFV
jgi:hypothetical protein